MAKDSTDLIPKLKSTLPKVLGEAGEAVSSRVIEFFTAEICNEIGRPTGGPLAFFRWVVDLSDILSHSTYPPKLRNTTGSV